MELCGDRLFKGGTEADVHELYKSNTVQCIVCLIGVFPARK